MRKIAMALAVLLLSFSAAHAENVLSGEVYRLVNDSIRSSDYEYFGCNPADNDSPIVIPLMPQLIRRDSTFEDQIIPLTVIVVPSS